MAKYKVLLTGNNTAVMDDFFNHLLDRFELMTSSLHFEDLDIHIKLWEPDILLACLHGESSEEISRFARVLQRHGDKTVYFFIIGTDSECQDFQRYSKIVPDLVLVKPLTSADILRYIQNFMQKKEDEEESERIASQIKAAQEAKQMAAAARKKILVVDDDPLILKILNSQLSNTYDVAAAINAKLAYKFMEKKKPDLILLDYEMPGESGPEVFSKLRAMPEYEDIPIIFLTGVTDKDKIISVLSLKPQGYVLKPLDMNVLQSTIKKFLD